MQIHTHNSQSAFEFLYCCEQDKILDHSVEILKQSAIEESEEPKKPEPEPNDRTVAVWKLTERTGLNEGCLRTLIRTSSEQQQLDK